MYCTKCGTPMDDNATVCGKCGKPVPAELLARLRASAPDAASEPVPATEPIELPASEPAVPAVQGEEASTSPEPEPAAPSGPQSASATTAGAVSAAEPVPQAGAPTPAQEPEPDRVEIIETSAEAESAPASGETTELGVVQAVPEPPISAVAAAQPVLEPPISAGAPEQPVPEPPISASAPEQTPAEAEAPRPAKPRRLGCGWAVTAGMLSGCALLIVAALALLGVYQGFQERNRLNRAAALEHLNKGLQHFSSQNYELARAEFELTLQLDPNNTEASARLTETNAVLSRRPTPTSAIRHQTAVQLFNEARELYNKADWEGMVRKLEEVQALEPEYETQQVNQLLVEAYYKAGQALRDENRMEEAVRYFDRALTLNPGDVAIREQKRLAALYIAGLGYWNANWQGAIDSFTVLYQQKPDYKDTRKRLHDAYVALGDQLFGKRDWCAARDRYESALTIMVSETAIAKRDDANVYCSLAPATSGTPAPKGTYVGSLVKIEDVRSQTAMMIRGTVYDAKGKPMPGIRVGLSAFDWSAAPATTNDQGVFAFDGLGNPVVYTLTLPDLTFAPLSVRGEWSKLLWVEFRPQP